MADVNRRYFDNLMRDAGLSLRGLAARMGVSHSQLSLTFSGERRLKIEEAVLLSQIFGQPLADVIEAAGISTSMSGDFRAPVIGAVQGDGTITLADEKSPERVATPPGISPDALAVQFRTARTALEWLDGAVVFYRPLTGNIAPCMGSMSVAQVDGGPLVIATLHRGYRDGTLNLSGPYTNESVRVRQAAPIDLIRP